MSARRIVPVLAAVALACVLAACGPARTYSRLHETTALAEARRLAPASQRLESWAGLEEAVRRSLAFVSVKPVDGTAISRDGLVLTWADMRRTLEQLLALLPELDRHPELLAERFAWLRLDPEPLMTGYYAPFLDASPVPDERHRFPIYARPADIFELDLGSFHHRWDGQRLLYRLENGHPVPYFDREAIDSGGALAGRGLELAWLADPTDIFFLHIQGSGLLRFPDGTVKYALYDGKNGLQYVSLGKVLIERGLVPREGMSMKAIRDFLAANPQMRTELLATNPSYVFFRLGDRGPFGAMGKLLTPRVSVATDPKLLPLGSVLAFSAVLPPEAPGGDEARVAGIALAQDTGGAIKDARLDYYCGSGPDVEFFAGHIKARTTVSLLVSREVLP